MYRGHVVPREALHVDLVAMLRICVEETSSTKLAQAHGVPFRVVFKEHDRRPRHFGVFPERNHGCGAVGMLHRGVLP